MAQIRCGIPPIRIETGRFCNLPVENRPCEICNQNKVEDEFHFLMECPFTIMKDNRCWTIQTLVLRQGLKRKALKLYSKTTGEMLGSS